jgi:rod shape determining protein RodA
MSLLDSTRKNPAAAWRHLDFSLAAVAVITAIFGVVMIYSATHQKLHAAGLDSTYYFKRQVAFVVLGIGVMVLVASIDYRIFRDYSLIIYPVMVFVLVVVLTPLGSRTRGQQGWFQLGSFQLQPSEFAKIALIVCLAAYCANQRGELDWGALVRILAFALVPMLLIYKQPDLGTALVFVAILMGMLLVAGARPRHLVLLAALGVFGVVAVLQLGVLKQYQLDRLGAFLDPTGDTRQSSYNLNQSKIAIGSGGVFGRGLFKGSQTNLSYVPEQNTDFIFTVVGEELGLFGSALLLALFAIMVWRTWRSASLAKDLSGTLVCVGILSMLVFQIFENVGMTMGIMPITGIPLPFMSYGGSSTLVSFAAVGLVLNVHMRRFS